MKYYIVENGRAAGPFEPYELMARGMTSRSFVWNKTMSRWTQAGRVPELQPMLSGGVTFGGGSEYDYLAPAKYGPAANQPPRRRVAYVPAADYYAAPRRRRSNTFGIAGFVVSMVVLFILLTFGLVIFYSRHGVALIYLNIFALVLSIIGMCRRPRGLAIAGLVVSGLVMMILILAFLGAFSYSLTNLSIINTL